MDTRAQIKNFIIDNFMMGRDASGLSDTASLLDLGIIDSTGVLELVSHIEQTYGFSIDDEELIPDNLDSIDRICNYISRKRQ